MPNPLLTPIFTFNDAQKMAYEHFQIKPSIIKPLPSYDDQNFLLQTTEGKQFVLKIMAIGTELKKIELEHLVMLQLGSMNYDLQFPQPIPNKEGAEITEIKDSKGQTYFMRLLTWIEGQVIAKANPQTPGLLEKLGKACGRICWELQGLEHPAAHRKFNWDNSQAIWTKENTHIFQDAEKKDCVEYFVDLYEREALPFLDNLPKSIIHNDLNDFNVLVKGEGDGLEIAGVIDFGDVVYTNTINELAICMAYNCMNKDKPMEAARRIFKGCHDTFHFIDEEIKVLFPLMAIRLVVSVTSSQLTLIQNPTNKDYLLAHQQPAWRLLKQLKEVAVVGNWRNSDWWKIDDYTANAGR